MKLVLYFEDIGVKETSTRKISFLKVRLKATSNKT